MFLLAPFGCIYYPIEILPEAFQKIAYSLPLVYVFEEARNILINNSINLDEDKLQLLVNHERFT